ncbi:Cytochrome P450 4V2 [Ophiocordyceps camponoti-floridani]|uniref:Cytochrome P450 4V2 n=1 Tax=Ophiocordyceps camponoti-floridani TaxID=2030778 RepID=A0A8H4QBE9_9HYPO|nr:Cytochrome P450 4V2 [Ophiocordyceps camponoti-floridani]
MAVPWRQMTAAAVAGDACLLWMQQDLSKTLIFQCFALLWLVQLVGWAIWRTYIYPHYTSSLRHLPQPDNGHWLYGHRSGLHPGDIGVDAKRWVNSVKHNHFIRYLDFFNKESLLVTSPRAISEMLVSNNYNFPRSFVSRTLVGRYTGYGIGIAVGDEHKLQRRILNPAFSLKHIRQMYPAFWAKGDESALAMAVDSGGAIDVHSKAVCLGLDIMGVTAMGLDFGAVGNENLSLVQAYSQLMAWSVWQDGLLILLQMVMPKRLVSRLPLRRNREIDESLGLIHNVCRQGIRATKKAMAAGTHSRPDICSVVLEAGIDEELLMEQLTTFLFAGQHAISKSLTAVVYALACAPDKQQRLRDELRTRLARFLASEGNERPSYADIDGLPYLNAVIKEALRKHSTGTSSRETKSEIVIQGVRIPRGTTIKLATYATSNDPEFWGDDVDEFLPERWLEGADVNNDVGNGDGRDARIGGASSKYAFMPFMQGPQGCLAVRLYFELGDSEALRPYLGSVYKVVSAGGVVEELGERERERDPLAFVT